MFTWYFPDLRRGNDAKNLITTKQAKTVCKQLKAVGYVECSALKKIGVEECFQMAVSKAVADWEGIQGVCLNPPPNF